MQNPRRKYFELLGSQVRGFLLLGALLCCGFGAVLIQAIGWVTMIPTQLVQTGSVTEAVENTFSGEHPCEFCKAAERLRDLSPPDSSEPEPVPPVQKDLGKNLLTARLKAIPLIRPCEIFVPRDREETLRFGSVILDMENPPPQGS